MKFFYKGYLIIQSNYDYHIIIYKKNTLFMHLSATEKLTKNDIKSLVNFYLKEEN